MYEDYQNYKKYVNNKQTDNIFINNNSEGFSAYKYCPEYESILRKLEDTLYIYKYSCSQKLIIKKVIKINFYIFIIGMFLYNKDENKLNLISDKFGIYKLYSFKEYINDENFQNILKNEMSLLNDLYEIYSSNEKEYNIITIR